MERAEAQTGDHEAERLVGLLGDPNGLFAIYDTVPELPELGQAPSEPGSREDARQGGWPESRKGDVTAKAKDSLPEERPGPSVVPEGILSSCETSGADRLEVAIHELIGESKGALLAVELVARIAHPVVTTG